jgi:hypothetical protein
MKMSLLDRFKKAQVEERGKGKAPQKVMGYLYDEEDIEKEPFSELQPPEGLAKYRNMKKNDPIIGGLMLRIENILRSTKWKIVGPNADFVKAQLEGLPQGINSLVQDMASSLTYGFSVNEKVWGVRDGIIYIKDVAPRHQLTIQEFANGKIYQLSANFAMPISKCLHFIPIEICRNPFGESILRHIYKPYYYKSSIEASEALGIDRDLGGLPIMQAPEGFDFTKADTSSPNYDPNVASTVDWAKNVVKYVRKDSSQGVILPHGWILNILKSETRSTIPTSDIVNRYNTEMAVGLLESFAVMGGFASTNNANTEAHIEDFLETCNTILGLMAEKITKSLIHDICAFNNLTDYPELQFVKVRRARLDRLASFVSRLVDKEIITVTNALEEELLQIASLPYRPDDKKELVGKMDG